jgi:hypothetical protein
LNLDAYGHIENLALYPTELRTFLDRGGTICWGVVPNNEEIRNVGAEELADRLRAGIGMISEKAMSHGVKIATDEFAVRSLISPACGLGSTTVEISDEVFDKLARTDEILKKGKNKIRRDLMSRRILF